MNRSDTYYIKKGRKYIPTERYTIDGVQEGLWLVCKKPHSTEHREMLHAVKVHDINNVGRFCDFYKAHHEQIKSFISKNYEKFHEEKKASGGYFSMSDLADIIIKSLSEIDE